MSAPKFCSNCGERLDENIKVDECPKCHSALHEHSKHMESPSRIVELLPYKSPGTTALIAFLGGIFGLPGIGHMYVGKVRRGIIILVSGFILYAYLVYSVYTVTILSPLGSIDVGNDNLFSDFIIMMILILLAFIVGYFVLFVWQIFNARNLAKKFNQTVRTTGKEPW